MLPDADRVQRLALQASQGSSDAYGELVRCYSGRILAFCRGKAPGQAEDLAQEIFVTAYRRFGTYDPSRPFGAWLFAVARSVAIDLSRRRVLPTVEAELDAVDNMTPAEELSISDAEELFWRMACTILTSRQLEVLRLRTCAGLSVEETAAATDLSKAAVKIILFRARKALIASGADLPLRESSGGITPVAKKGYL